MLTIGKQSKKGWLTMGKQVTDPTDVLRSLSEGNLKTMDVLRNFVEVSFEESGLDPRTFMLVRIAALATLEAAPASWLMNLEASGDAGLQPESILGVLIAIAPVIGTARVVSAASGIMQALEAVQ